MTEPFSIRPFVEPDRHPLIELWTRCELTRPWNDPSTDIDRKLRVDPDGLIVAEIDRQLIASVMVGYDGHRGWVNYLAVDPAHTGSGHGRRLMEFAEERLAERGCPKINLQIRTTNLDAVRFYESIGYAIDEVVSMGKRLVDD